MCIPCWLWLMSLLLSVMRSLFCPSLDMRLAQHGPRSLFWLCSSFSFSLTDWTDDEWWRATDLPFVGSDWTDDLGGALAFIWLQYVDKRRECSGDHIQFLILPLHVMMRSWRRKKEKQEKVEEEEEKEKRYRMRKSRSRRIRRSRSW